MLLPLIYSDISITNINKINSNMRKLLLFFAMLCVSVGTWAAITITPDPNPYNQTWIGAEQIPNSKVFTISGWDNPGDVAKLLNGDTSLDVNWNGKSLADLQEAIIIHIGAGANTDLLNDDDLKALDLLASTKYLDLDGSKLAAGASINNIEIGSAVEGVVLPDGLSKNQVNAVATVLSANENFGSCISKKTDVIVAPVTNYYYAEGSNNGQKVVESATVVLDKENLKATVKENVQVDLTLEDGYPKFKYTNTWNNNEEVYVTASDVEQYDAWGQTKYRIKPNPLKVNLNKTTKYYKTDEDGGQEMNTWDMALVDGVYYYGGNWNWNEQPAVYEGGTPAVVKEAYSYSNNGNNYVYSGTPTDNGDGTYTGEIVNNDVYFDVTSEYLYTYELDGETIEYVPNSEDTDLKYDTTHDVVYSVEARNEEETTSEDNVIAYVNKAGSLYKSTHVAPVSSNLSSVVISGNVNNGDIAVNDGASDPNGNKNDSDKFTNTAVAAFYMNSKSCSIKSFDIGDCNIEDYKYLRVLDAFGESLESVVFPKTVTRIPNYCCYSSNNAVKNLTNIVFPTASSFTIGDYAFHGTAIKSLVIPSTVTQVGDFAFATCPNLYDVEMEALKADCRFGNNVFEQCPALQHVTLSEKVINIGDYMFNQCGLLESIRIPSTCTTIGSYAFQFCYSIHEVTIPEGVELIKLNAFEGAGLTDLYIMASSIDKLPKIYAMSPTGAGPSTFTHQRTTGNNTIPRAHEDELPGADYDEVMTWYQEEQSGAEGLGTGNCLTALHYPESLKPFFEAIDITEFSEQLGNLESIPLQTTQQGIKHYYTPNEYLNFADAQYKTTLQYIVENQMDPAYGSGAAATFVDGGGNTIPYQYLPQSYGVDPRKDGSGTKLFGPDKDGNYYPNQTSYLLRMVAGATGTQAGGVGGQEVASAWGWRQFPLASSIESIGEIPFEKKYDDTWYTMCFPWRMIDNQLFSAFNQKCEIVEFKGAEMVKQDDENYSLIFHFDDVAATYYMDEAGVEYSRERDGDRVDAAGHNLYVYTSKKDGTVVSAPDPLPTSNSGTQEAKEQYGKYLTIQNIMVLPGHPYMIHPSIGANPGSPATVYINGVKKIVPGEGLYKDFETLKAVAEANKVERKVAEISSEGEALAEVWQTPDGKDGGSYTFIGNINDDENGDLGKQDMPLPCYFLGVKAGTVYPKYYRRTTGGQKKWSQYSAIIVPDEAAQANIEEFMSSSSTSTSTGAKEMGDVVFGEWEVVDADQMATVIDNAVAEGKEKNEPAKIQHLNVVYNIKGQVVRSNSTSVEGLPKGLYIVNGKKYMVK